MTNVELYSNEQIAPYFEVLDLDTGRIIRWCTYANQETGEYKQCICDNAPYNLNNEQEFKGNIVLVYKGE